MKVALINPPAEQNIIRRWRCSVEQGHYLFPPIELAYVSSMLKREGAEVYFVDCVAEGMTSDDLKEKLEDFNPEMIIFLPGFERISEDVELMEKSKNKLAKMGCFGFLPTLYAKDLLEKSNLDFIICGEPEFVSAELYKSIKNHESDWSKIEGIAYRSKKGIIITKKQEEIQNLDSLPFPDRSSTNHKKYSSGFPDKHPMTVMMSARGCPFRCTYCIRSYGDKLRQRSPENTVDEIQECVTKFNIRSIRFLDDTFTANKQWVMKVCSLIKERKLKLQWTCLARPDTMDEEVIKEMASAGCNRVLLGIESGSKKILKDYARNPGSLDNLRNICKWMRKSKIQSLAFFLVGAPEETKEDVEESLKVAITADPDFITVNMMRIYPGTTMYSQLMQQGNVDMQIFPFKSSFKSKLTPEEVQAGMFKLYRHFYFRPAYLFRMIPYFIRHPLYMYRLASEYLKWEYKGTNFGNAGES